VDIYFETFEKPGDFQNSTLLTINHEDAKNTPVEYASLSFGIQRGEAKKSLYVRRVKRRTYIVSPEGQSLLCVPSGLWFKKGNTSTKSTMSLRSRFIGAVRRGQNSPMDTVLKRPTREPQS